MKRFRPLLALLLMFMAGLFVGVVGTRVATRIIVRRALENPGLVRVQIERDLTRRLHLDADQQVKIHDTLMDAQKQLHELRQEFQPGFVQIIDQADERIAATLTPEQEAKFEKIKDENRRLFSVKTNH